jgi:hypothetical protein
MKRPLDIDDTLLFQNDDKIHSQSNKMPKLTNSCHECKIPLDSPELYTSYMDIRCMECEHFFCEEHAVECEECEKYSCAKCDCFSTCDKSYCDFHLCKDCQSYKRCSVCNDNVCAYCCPDWVVCTKCSGSICEDCSKTSKACTSCEGVHA